MDIRPKSDKPNESDKAAGAKQSKFSSGTVQQASAALMLPPAVKAKLSHLSQVYGLPIDIGEMSTSIATPENLKALRKVVHFHRDNAKLFPEFLKLAKELLNADISTAEYHANIVKLSNKHQIKIDKEMADIFISMAKYNSKAVKLEARINTRTALMEKRNAAYVKQQEESVFGVQSQIVDIEYQIAASNQQTLGESKTKRMKFNAEAKEKSRKYIDAAFED